jgi:hypothetical protein
MNRKRYSSLLCGSGLVLWMLAAPAPGQVQNVKITSEELNLRSYIALLRSDLRSSKAGVVEQVMLLNESEGAKFWPIYREYEAELIKLWDDKLAVIRDYVARYDQLTEKEANDIAEKAFALEIRKTELKRKYFPRVAKALSSQSAVRFFQVENQLLMLIDLQVASLLPIAGMDTGEASR